MKNEDNKIIKDDNKEENKKYILIIFLLLIAISIGYATLSSTLKIKGNGGIDKIRWDVHFENVVEDVWDGVKDVTNEAVEVTWKGMKLVYDTVNPIQ